MTCNPTRLELSNTDATTVDVTITTDPGDGIAVVLEVPGLSIIETQNTSGAAVSYSLAARTEDTNSLWDGTLQVGTNAPADIVVQIVETSAAQTVGVTISDTNVSYCAPSGGGGTAGGPTETAYTYGIERLGDRFQTGASVMLLGDSTTDGIGFTVNSIASRLMNAAQLNWTPNAWKGLFFKFSSSSPYAPSTVSQQNISLQDGERPTVNTNPGLVDLGYVKGEQFVNGAWGVFDWPGSSTDWATALRIGPDPTIASGPTPNYDYTSLHQTAGGDFQTFYDDGVNIKFRMGHLKSGDAISTDLSSFDGITSDTTGYGLVNDPELNVTEGMTELTHTGTTYTYDTSVPASGAEIGWQQATTTLNWVGQTDKSFLDGKDSFRGIGVQTIPPDADWESSGNATGAVFYPVGLHIENQDVTDGLVLTDCGLSGSNTRDHRYEPDVGYSNGTKGYTTKALRSMYVEMEIDTVNIWLGINDANASIAASEFKANVQFIIDRNRSAHEAAGTSRAFRAVLMSSPDWNPSESARTLMASYGPVLKDLVDDNDDVCFVDMYQWWRDNFGGYDEYAEAYLNPDETTGSKVHQSNATGQIIAQRYWEMVNGRSGVVSVNGDTGPYVRLVDSYLMLIETPADGDYTIDGRVATARTITNVYAKTDGGTCTLTLKNLTDATTIGSVSVTDAGGSASSLSNTAVGENDRLGITIGANLASDLLEIVVEYIG